VVCLCLALTFLALYARQVYVLDWFRYKYSDRFIGLSSSLGTVGFSTGEHDQNTDGIYGGLPDGWSRWHWEPIESEFDWWFVFKSTESYWGFSIPNWCLVLLFASKPTRSFLAARRCRRLTLGSHPICAACGYNLHSVKGNTCPECGEGFSNTAQGCH
jgi:hypothetical protein